MSVFPSFSQNAHDEHKGRHSGNGRHNGDEESRKKQKRFDIAQHDAERGKEKPRDHFPYGRVFVSRVVARPNKIGYEIACNAADPQKNHIGSSELFSGKRRAAGTHERKRGEQHRYGTFGFHTRINTIISPFFLQREGRKAGCGHGGAAYMLHECGKQEVRRSGTV